MSKAPAVVPMMIDWLRTQFVIAEKIEPARARR